MSRMVHLCYAGTSGATRVALNISLGSSQPQDHAYVFYGVEELREDYRLAVERLGCPWRYVPKRGGVDLQCYKASARAICELGPTVAAFHGLRSLPVELRLRAMRPRLPVVAVQHGPVELDRVGRLAACVAFGAAARCTVAVSDSVASRLARSALTRWACRPLRVIHNGLDEKFWRPAAPEAPASGCTIGMIGTLESFKDQPTLIRAVARLREGGLPVRLELAGTGSREEELRQLAASLGLGDAVAFLGNLSQEAVRAAVHRWNVMVHSTHTEGLSMALLEGMMSARPVAASDVEGVCEVVRDGRTGLLFPHGDDKALAVAVQRLLGDRALAAQLGSAARNYAVENFSVQRMSREYELFFQHFSC